MELSSSENPTQPTPEVEDLSKKVEESRIRLSEGSGSSPFKRGRGRPKGTTKVRPTGTMQSQGTETISRPHVETVRTGEMVPILAIGLKVPFDIAAENTGFEKFRLTDEEAQMPATQLDIVLAHYLPDLSKGSPLKMAIISFGASFGMIAMSKYYAYTHWKKTEVEAKKIVDKKGDTNTKTPESERPYDPIKDGPRVEASEFFSDSTPFPQVQV